MGRKPCLRVAAIGEGLTGLFLLLLPAAPLSLSFGGQAAAPDDDGGPALRASLTGILVDAVLVAVVLADAGFGPHFVGVLLWPAVVARLAVAI